MKLHYQVEGEGPAIVFIHGLSDNLQYWEPLSSTLKDDYTVVRYDLRGHGESELCNEITLDLFVEDLHNLLEDLNIKKANLVGFSLGGVIALEFAVKYPSFASSIVLMSSFPKISPRGEEVLNQFLNALDKGYEEFYDFMIPRVLCPDVIEEYWDELEMLKSISAQTANVEAYKKAVHAMFCFDIWEELEYITIPTLVLAGKYDEITLADEQKELSEKIPNSKWIILDNLKHNLLVGKKISEIIYVLNEFLKK